MDSRIEPFRVAANAFLGGRISAPEFETLFLALFRGVSKGLVGSQAQELDRLFSAVDAYCSDPELRDGFDIDELGLHRAVADFIAHVGG
ncbi:colicin immunity domain-containing protein [Streptacidiphilus melanogenes]|uniref:colicin immunity domain-containing protein n=1 Tax=Streptacidiphilus melanogenes TaxID=411235 RepID=UPI000A022F87